VSLSPGGPTADALGLDEAIASGDAASVALALAAITRHGGLARSVWLVAVGTGPLDRAVVVRCGPGACESPRRVGDTALLALDAAAVIASEVPSEAGDRAAMQAALRWVDEIPIEPPPTPPSLLEEWWLWASVGAVVVGAGVAIGLAAQPSGEAPLVLRFDPCLGCAP